jgi:hypothetical protein
MVATPPLPTPVTTPDPDTVATAKFDEDQAPLGVASLRVIVLPAHTTKVAAVIAAGAGFTTTFVMADVALQPVELATSTV